MDDLQYNTPQDKLLVMLLERISSLEDEVRRNNSEVLRLVSSTTSRFFGVYLSGKYLRDRLVYEILDTHLDSIKSSINAIFPDTKVYVLMYNKNESGHMMLELKDNWMLQHVQFKLDKQIRAYVNMNSWTMLHESVPSHYKQV